MAYIFLDESGDLGFNFKKAGASKYFIITILFVDNYRPIEKVVRKIHSTLKKKHKQKSGVLHCYHESPITRRRMLRRLNEKEIKIMAICLNKHKVYTKFHNQKDVLYNYVTNILLDRIYNKKLIPIDKQITLIASRKETNKFLNSNFKEYLKNQIKENHKTNITIEIKTPYEEKCLQAVDFLSWSIFRKYQQEDDSYYKIISSKIFEENPLFP